MNTMTQTPSQLGSPVSAVPTPLPQAGTRPQPMPAPTPMPQQSMPSPQTQPAPPQMPQAVPAPMPPMPQPGSPMPAPQMPPPQAQATAGVVVQPIQNMGYGEADLSHEGGEKALPKIAIHAFCDRQETAGVINETTRDWRMKRTNIKIYMGGLPAAIEYYHKENTPNLILIESGMRGAELFAQLEQLASVCDAGTKVMMIGAANDIKLYRQLMEKGVSDYIVPPFHPINLIRSMAELYFDPEKPFVGRVAAFFGAKGGVGSSTLAHNIAWCLSEKMQQETALVDMDASWGTTGLDFAYDASQGLEEALAEPERLDETLLDRIMIRHTAKLSILPTAGSLNQKPIMSSEAYEAVVDGVRGISPLTLLDMPHFWTDWTTNILTNTDDVIITATPDLANLRNTKNLIDFLKAQRPNDSDPILILNKTGMTKSSEIAVKDFAAAVNLEPALVLGFDPDSYFEAANEGKMLTDVKSAAQAVNGMMYIADRLKTGQFGGPIGATSGKSKGRKLKKNSGDAGASKSLFSFMKKKK